VTTLNNPDSDIAGTFDTNAGTVTLDMSFSGTSDNNSLTSHAFFSFTRSGCFAPIALTAPPNISGCVVNPSQIGQATAIDPCGLPVTITNNAPTTFGLNPTTVTWTASTPDGRSTTVTQTVSARPALFATQSITVGNGAKVLFPNASGAAQNYAPIVNTGSGQLLVQGLAKTGSLFSLGPISIESQANIFGNVESGSSVTPQQGAVITGTTMQDDATATYPSIPAIPLQNLSTNGPTWWINPGQTPIPHLTPGPYGAIGLGPNDATLILDPGVYVVGTLNTQPGGILQITGNGKVTFYVTQSLNLAGVPGSGFAPDQVTIYYLGQNANINGPFTGQLYAPFANVTLGTGRGTIDIGTVFAKEISLQSGVQWICQTTTQDGE
jgi:hypothetical protein